ncbi:hypothetical protein pipiens_005815 [Culex pipiens pipiens]|uniref:G-protein coupled receptors family 1 profile domain-containing protein n=1 Tax=Culex pipiens pipiens TaxID=38569 RepID=A0ABD1DTK2_CULPP
MYLSAGLRKIMDNAHPQLEEQLQLDPNHTGVKPHEGDHVAPAFGDEAFHRNLAVLTGNGSGILGLDMSNGTSDAEISAPGYTDSTVAVIIVYCVLFIIAAGGNLSVVITLFRSRRHRRSRVSLMICHLAVADLMVAFIMIPLEVGWRITVQWHAGNVACKVFLFMRAFCLYLSSNVLVCVSLDRCFAVIYPLRVSAARKRGKIMLGGAWFIAFANALPQNRHRLWEFQIAVGVPFLVFVRDVQTHWTQTAGSATRKHFEPAVLLETNSSTIEDITELTRCFQTTGTTNTNCWASIIFRVQQHPQVPGFTQCVTFGFFRTPGMETAYNLFCVIAMYFMPLMIISAAYTVILCEISNRSREKETSDTSHTGGMRLRCNDLTHIERARQRTLRLTITIVVVFVWCWTPYVVMTLWYMFDRESAIKVDGAIQDGLFLMAVSNSCMNPLVYGSYAMKCRWPWKRQNVPNGVATPNAAQRRSTGECLPGTATTRFGYCAVTSGRAVNEPWVRSANMATVSYGNATASYVPRKGCKPSYSEFAVLADERSLMLSRPSFYSDPTPNELDSSVDGGLTRSLDTGGWR